LFLDEVDKLSLQTQAALLRLLEERVYRPVGEARGERPADVRFIIGTNADLKAAVQDGRFREDLYDRLNVLPVKIPPLDERADEIADWADFMLDRHHRETAANGRARLAEGAGETLRARRWPGNLRQLDNVVRRAYALASGDRAGRETPETPRDVEIATRHIERALAGESANRIDLLEEWRRAARAFVLEVERRRSGSGQHLPMDMLDAFRGLVLEEAQQGRPPTEALKLLGLDRDVESRNHHRTIRWGRDKVEALKRALSNTPPPSPDDPQGAREARK
ncbi:MAG TPA: sigma 54-interacting transcriptional regulator, partial [Polyangiaceae bacterium]|nr:sigma 54-interacting transcriptional regulator [Polyangiaceae bacterium]